MANNTEVYNTSLPQQNRYRKYYYFHNMTLLSSTAVAYGNRYPCSPSPCLFPVIVGKVRIAWEMNLSPTQEWRHSNGWEGGIPRWLDLQFHKKGSNLLGLSKKIIVHSTRIQYEYFNNYYMNHSVSPRKISHDDCVLYNVWIVWVPLSEADVVVQEQRPSLSVGWTVNTRREEYTLIALGWTCRSVGYGEEPPLRSLDLRHCPTLGRVNTPTF